ncbi:hypothetical protein EPUL_000639, partial [Erysiphe pulchra]
MVVAGLDRSAVIAWNSRPRIPLERSVALSEPPNRASTDQQINLNRTSLHNQTDCKKSDYAITNVSSYPVWGEILHDGWSSPLSVDFPNLQYITVISELPLLIEAKAISLTSPNKNRIPSSLSTHNRTMMILKRRVAMGLREYINYLSDLNVVTTPDTVHEFISLYEYSRFSTKPISEQEFRKLMNYFTEILRSMQPLDSEVLNSDKDSTEEYFGDDSDLELSSEFPRSQELISVDSNSNQSGSISGSNGTIRRGYTWFNEVGENLFKAFNYSPNNEVEGQYDHLRTLARQEQEKRSSFSKKSQEAYKQGDGATAHQLSEQAKKHATLAAQYNQQASDYIFRENNAAGQVDEDTIDLHGQYVEEAGKILEQRIRYAQKNGQSHLHVPRVEQICQQLHLRYSSEEDNAGRIYINLQSNEGNHQPHGNQTQTQTPTYAYPNQPTQLHQHQNQPSLHQQPPNTTFPQTEDSNDELERLARKILPKVFKKLDGCCVIM